MTKQLALWCDDELAEPGTSEATIDIDTVLATANTFIFSLSGGKDSDAMTRFWLPLLRERRPEARFVAVHANLGRAEWGITESYIQHFCQGMNLELHIVQHSKYDLIDGIRARMEKRPDAPPFPSSAARYCTSDWKRSVISRWIRQNCEGEVAVLMGLRAEESPARAKRPRIALRTDSSAPTKDRTVWDVLPIHDWTLKDVWGELGYSLETLQQWREETLQNAWGFSKEKIIDNLLGIFGAHPAYALGNERLSCALCILASTNDLMNGAEHEPDTYRELCQIEMESGFSFRQNLWLMSLRPDLLGENVRAWGIQQGHIT